MRTCSIPELVHHEGESKPINMSDRKSGKDDNLKKKIYRSALTKTVKNMNKSLDDTGVKKKSEKNTMEKLKMKSSGPKKSSAFPKQKRIHDVNEKLSDAKGSRKKGAGDNHGLFPCKQQRYAFRKMNQETASGITSKEKENYSRGEVKNEKVSGRLTRKKRRFEKERTGGKGMPSKEYYEKFVKKSNDSEKKTERYILPSKRKEDFPQRGEDNTKKRKLTRRSSLKRSRR